MGKFYCLRGNLNTVTPIRENPASSRVRVSSLFKGFSLVGGWRGKFVVVSYLTVLESDRANEKCIGVSPRRLNSFLADYLE